MAISRVNPVTTALNAISITAASPNTLYEGRTTLDPAIYTVTCISSTITGIDFLSGQSTVLASGTTASGSTSINLASTADRFRVWTNTGSNVVITITKTASAISNSFSGTLDTITSNTTYTQTSPSGLAYTVVVGGGGGGGGGGASFSGGVGGAGGVGAKIVQLTGSMPIVIGAAGSGNGGNAGPGTAGTATTFAGITANGGGGGLGNSNAANKHGTPGTVTGGTYNISATYGSGGATTEIYPFVAPGTTGNGGGGGSGIGTGGNNATPGGHATGYGSGGGAGTYSGSTGGNGRPGVVYVLRF